MSEEKNLTPLMRQYFDVKNKYPDTILLFQVGDFYELFFEDAQKAAPILGIALTQRGTHKGDPIPLCGVPLHVLDHYLAKLIRAGFKVALCDQLEQPKPGKLVERGVTQVLTPGTLTDLKLLDEKSASYLAVFFPQEESWTFLFAELLTGHLLVMMLHETSPVLLDAELHRFMPAEIIVPDSKLGQKYGALFQRQGYSVTYEQFKPASFVQAQDSAKTWFERQFPQAPQSLAHSAALRDACTLLYTYLQRNNEQGLAQLKTLTVYKPEDYVLIDAATQRNLELIKNSADGTSANTLFSVIDRAVTAMGSRTLKKWLLRPLINREHIEERLETVSWFVRDCQKKEAVRRILASIGDLERVVGRIALERAQLYDYRALLKAVTVLPEMKQLLSLMPQAHRLRATLLKLEDFTPLQELLIRALNDDTSKEWLIKEGFEPELDRMRSLLEKGAQAILALEAQEQARTRIGSLKIRYNQVNGYGIEVTTPNLSLVPADYVRIQTLANRERFTMPALKDLEYNLQRARNEGAQVEKALFDQVKVEVACWISTLKKTAQVLAITDALAALAEVAYTHRYVRPIFMDDSSLIIEEGRHPVVEQRLKNSFIPNCVSLTNDESLWLITGPNMGGKSTFLRQVALTSILAQMGSFVPAKKASLMIVDRIFTRIGASDNMAEGKSTFLVEMEETALICNQATAQSLVILDEVGRGTSTFDGLALAQAIVEYIYTIIKARCLFATHYHELTALTERFPGIKPYYAASMKTEQGIVLLHKIVQGVADGSFGLEVASRAQLPVKIIARAREILAELKAAEVLKVSGISSGDRVAGLYQPAVLDVSVHTSEELFADAFERERAIAAEIDDVDVESLTAKQALDLIWRLKELL